jgi:hypothetical protein
MPTFGGGVPLLAACVRDARPRRFACHAHSAIPRVASTAEPQNTTLISSVFGSGLLRRSLKPIRARRPSKMAGASGSLKTAPTLNAQIPSPPGNAEVSTCIALRCLPPGMEPRFRKGQGVFVWGGRNQKGGGGSALCIRRSLITVSILPVHRPLK